MAEQQRRTLADRTRRGVLWVALLWLLAAVFVIVELFVHESFRPGWMLAGYALLTLVMSGLVFVLYGVDKQRARREKRRISERTLHTIELLGGWPGALVAQRLFRHKTAKMSYRLVYWLIVLLHFALVGYAIYRSFFGSTTA